MFLTNDVADSLLFEAPMVSNLMRSPELLVNSASSPQTIAFVDPHIADFQTILANLQADVTVLLDPSKDGVGQITDTLSRYQNLKSVEIVSHGNTGEVQLGNTFLNSNYLSQHLTELQQWRQSLATDADILLYGCYVADNLAGKSFVEDLSRLTGADVAASTNLTGNAAKGGDWQLEYATGQIETTSPFANFLTNSYQDVLQSIFSTQAPDNLNQSDGVGAAGDYELGMKFVSTKVGQIDAIRYYKAARETGTHTGRIWSSNGTLLGSVDFINETASGWQQQALTTPINISANSAYTVSVNANSYFVVSGGDISITNGDLTAANGGNNGTYNSTPGQLPTSSNSSNYFRDVVFTPTNQVGLITTAGIASQNQVLSANVTDADGLTGAMSNYKWQQSTNGTTWNDITGATANTFTLGQDQVNQRVRVNATFADAKGSSENIFSASTAAVVNANDLGTVTIAGTTTQNQVLTANVADVDGLTGVTINYKWQQSADGTNWTNIDGAINKTLALTQAQVNQRVRATATYTDALGNSESLLSTSTTAIANVNDTGKVILKGSATVGRSLTETVLDADGITGPIKYRWQQSTNGTNWTNIAGATGKNFVLTNNQLNKQVRLRTTYTDAFGNFENVVSAGTKITAQNQIVLENQKIGTNAWQIGSTSLARNNEIAGYGDAISINKGQSLNLKVSLAQASQYNVDVYRLGYYGGTGGRLMSSASGLSGVTQAAATIDPTTRLVEYKWNNSYTVQTGTDWTSGLYLAKLTDSTTGKQSYVEFVVRDDNRPAEIGFQDAYNTAAAYNNAGGYSSYTFNSVNNQAAYKVSFDRPLSSETNGILAWEYQTARWAEAQGYDISYYSNIDVHTNPNQLYSHNAFLSVGHDEYWSLEMRNSVEKARDNGTNLAFFSANSAYWRVRYEPSTTGQANRVLSIYKDNWAQDPLAQQDNSLATTRFRSAQVNRPENDLLGVMYTGLTNNVTAGYDFVVSNATDPYYAGTGLKNGDKIPGLVGYEWDAVVNNGLTPAGLVILSQSPVIPDGGTAPGLPPGTNTNISNAVRYKAASGAKVFSSGTIQWAWGLENDLVPNPRRNPATQKITTNILADLGALARTPQIF
jgi:hypothetical protein